MQNDREDLIDFVRYVNDTVVSRCSHVLFANRTDKSVPSHTVAPRWVAKCRVCLHDFLPSVRESETAGGENGSTEIDTDTEIPGPDSDDGGHNTGPSDSLLPELCENIGMAIMDDSSVLSTAPTNRGKSKQTLIWHIPTSPLSVLLDENGLGCGPPSIAGPDSVSGASSSYSISTTMATDPENDTQRIITSSSRYLEQLTSEQNFRRRAIRPQDQRNHTVPHRRLTQAIDARERVRVVFCTSGIRTFSMCFVLC